MPRIADILARCNGYKFFTKIDLSMQYYTFEFDEESSWLCVIVTPLGKYRYLRLPMGIKMSPDIAQEIMEVVLKDLADVECYLDDIGISSKSYDDHMRTVHQVLNCLQDYGFTVGPLKCE
jgi:hypothetical protein